MLRWYGWLGVVLIILSELNFHFRIEPFANWYLPIVWLGYILFVDSVVFRIKGSSLISRYPKEIAFIAIISVPFWLIFEAYNAFTFTWFYVNYTWQIHLVDFATILPALMETFSLVSTLGIAKSIDSARKAAKRITAERERLYTGVVAILVIAGAVVAFSPFFYPALGFEAMFVGIFLFLDPLNYLAGRPSVVKVVAKGRKSIIIQLFLTGIIMGFFWECWNFQALPQWIYNLPSYTGPKLFEMPLFGYFGYLPFAMEAFVFVALLRSFFFRGKNELISM